MPREKISIHALRGEGDGNVTGTGFPTVISIHALRGEGDANSSVALFDANISIHALRGEGDDDIRQNLFGWNRHFNPRPPWGGRHEGRVKELQKLYISIHALRGEGDNNGGTIPSISVDFNPRPPWGGRPSRTSALSLFAAFQSTPSVGRATSRPLRAVRHHTISIHALRGEGDSRKSHMLCYNLNFNPRPPWGGRRVRPVSILSIRFISIHALRGEGDANSSVALFDANISIHALRGEGDHL